MKFQSAEGCALPELVTMEVIAAVLPNSLMDLHTTYRYIDGVWKVQSVEFYDVGEALPGTAENKRVYHWRDIVFAVYSQRFSGLFRLYPRIIVGYDNLIEHRWNTRGRTKHWRFHR
ncbi:MAG: hypothetical protein PHP26_06245 [Syntrophomonas sp.]|uniref:hypothetical protein n=1 Tax=Syntrophomonas sp. TaxID=2053627 RepID=UPI002625990F|nr:hypothetical protein [Syntrophomonas sp.]MDD2510473.1 hypothetical protein [Syntrophomonas sp.]MDD3879573.1 hypothetical protein [Syntrophomonas sp.]MDD4627016.1 hypothetical protein [Syntrophomonas sp.]